MKSHIILIQIFVYVVIVCPIGVLTKHGKFIGSHYLNREEQGHNHRAERPCTVCPRHGRCVPRIQCPARVRSGSYNPSCHLDGAPGAVGVCCFTGRAHAAEHDHKFRTSSAVNVDDVKAAHGKSRVKLEEWLGAAAALLSSSYSTVVNITSPSFGHHLSVLTYDERADQLGRGGLLNLFATQELKARQAFTDEELELGFTDHTDGPFCPPPAQCPSKPSRYRTMGGECNNPAFPTWGAVHTGYERVLPPDYSDGVWSMRNSVTGQLLPSARLVSQNLLLDMSHPSDTHNLMFMQFGQFIAHDISSGVIYNIGNGSAIFCCSGDGAGFLPSESQHWACDPIVVEPDDHFYGQFRHTCLNFVRTQVAPNSDCSVGYAKQMNGVTHYLDLSQIYGSSEEKLSSLKTSEGLLRAFNDYGRELPPLTDKKECLTVNKGAACFESGDNHGNQIISLTALHTIWTREHNRVAKALFQLNPKWNEKTVFMESRRILQAEFQHIVYNEWLPSLLGPKIMSIFGLVPCLGYSAAYDLHMNPSLTAEFSTAALRFGHSVVDGQIMIPKVQSGGIYETISIPEVMFQPSRLRLRPFLDRILTGLSWQPMQAVDPFVTEALTRYLFHGGNPYGLDLAAINIQRGRDYGTRTYNHYRRLIGLEPYTDFNQFSPKAAQRLAFVYASPEDIDLWVGGLMEEPVDGGVVGMTFAHIMADQFAKLKKGDRYFYEFGSDVNPGAFTPEQLVEIKKVTMSQIICDNRDGIELLSQAPNAFIRADLPGNEPVPCENLLVSSMDLSLFRDPYKS